MPIGYSGHERGLQISLAAVALGAVAVERHITLDRAMWGSDQAASLEPTGPRAPRARHPHHRRGHGRRREARLPRRGGAAGQAASGACVSRTLLVVADTDSYVKWGAALASQLPADAWRVRLVVLADARAAERAAAAGRAGRLALRPGRRRASSNSTTLGELVAGLRPEAVLLALRGPLVRVVAPIIGARDRPAGARERIPRPHDPRRAEGRHLPGAGRPHRAAQPARGARVPRERREPRRARRPRARDAAVPAHGGPAARPGRVGVGRRSGAAAVGSTPTRIRRIRRRPHRPRVRRAGEGARRSARTACACSAGSRMPHAGVRSAGWS